MTCFFQRSSCRSGEESRRTGGFTILELLVASTVFAVILLVVAAGAISFTNDYYNGVTASKTQLTARSILTSIAASIQFGQSAGLTIGANGAGWLCVGDTLYSFQIGQEVIDTNPNAALHQGHHGLVITTGSNCFGITPPLPTAGSLASNQQELLGQHMRLAVLNVTNNGTLYTIRVRILYGDDDLFVQPVNSGTNWSTETCAAGRAGFQFCGVSDLTTTVEQRL